MRSKRFKFSANALRAKRKEMRLSLVEMADMVGMSKSKLSEVERGITSPTSEELIRLKGVLNATEIVL